MRAVTRQIQSAFRAHRSRTVGNTHTDGETVFLHGNKIIERRDDGSVWATLAGWSTPTTRERINGITKARFSQKDFASYLNGEPCDPCAWYRVES